MSDLDNAIESINTAAERTTNTTEFVENWSTLDDQSDVTNPNNNVTVPSAQKKTRLVAEAAFAASFSEHKEQIDQAVYQTGLDAATAEASATEATSARDVTIAARDTALSAADLSESAKDAAVTAQLSAEETVADVAINIETTITTNVSVTNNLIKFHPIY